MARIRPPMASSDKESSKAHSYKPGSLRKIELQNFMCHEQFTQEFGPRVNFIIGPNGSGKSAVLTAIVVVLGGRATTTSRARRLSEFVQYGKRFAKVTLTLQNYDSNLDQSKAFERSDFGKLIIIEKTIYKDDTPAKLTLMNENGKKVSELKQTLDNILEHFSIHINNPICILNQEVSKSFLHSKKPEDKFDLFMKATNLEQIQGDYEEARSLQLDWRECNYRKAFTFRLIDDEKSRCKEKLNFLENRIKMGTQLAEYEMSLAWAIRRDQELEAVELEKKLGESEDTVEMKNIDIKRSRDKISDSETKIQEYLAQLTATRTQLEVSKQKVANLKASELNTKTDRINIEMALSQERRKLTRLEKDKSDLIKSIDQIKGQLNNKDSAKENEKRKLEIEQLERKTSLLASKDTTLRQRAEQIHQSMRDIKQQLSTAVNRTSRVRSELHQAESSLRSLRAGEINALRKFGPNMQRICEAINKAHEQGRFEKKPIGPLGFYIKVKTPEVATVLELSLGKNVFCFTCDNHRDMLALQTVFRNVRMASGDSFFREPPIFVRPFKSRHDVNRTKPRHEIHRSMIDLLDIKEDAVFNALVDRTGIETAMFIPDYKDARNIMITPSLVPAGARSAYTKDCHVLYPRTQNGGFRSIAMNTRRINYYFTSGNDQQIRVKQEEIERIKTELRSAEELDTKLKNSDRDQRKEYDAVMKECESNLNELRPLEVRLLELKTTLAEDQPQELIGIESELESCIARIHEAKTKITELEFKLDTLDTELSDKKAEIEAAIEVQSIREKETDVLNDKVAKEKDLITEHNRAIKAREEAIKNAEKIKEEILKSLEIVKSHIDEHNRLVNDGRRPEVIRPTEEIRGDIARTKRALSVEVEENQDPLALMEKYSKRIDEIGQICSLRDENLKHYASTKKSLKDREEGFNLLRRNVCGSVSCQFASVMTSMNMKGELNIYFNDHLVNGNVVNKARTLEMSIDTGKTSGVVSQRPMIDANNSVIDSRRGTRSQPAPADVEPRSKRPRLTGSPSEKENHGMTDTRSLSGGERSFSTVAFVLSLWHHCRTPFKLMDEIDVFMDMITRRTSYNALINFAKKPDNVSQFIYFSPLQLPDIDDSEGTVRVFEMPQIIRQNLQ